MSRPTTPRAIRAPALRASLRAVLLGLTLLMACSLGLLWPRASFSDRLVAVSWGGGPQGQALYGAYVVLEPAPVGLEVVLLIYIDRPTAWIRQTMGPIKLGTVASDEEAVRRWGRLAWEDRGLVVGTGPESRLIPAADLSRHR